MPNYDFANGSIQFATDCVPITPSDANNLSAPVRALRATVAGNIQITTANGNTRVCAFAAGETRPIGAIRVWSTNTTATGIEGYV